MQTCIEAGVGIVTGDTKVVEKGSLGGCVMNVSGIGKRTASFRQQPASCQGNTETSLHVGLLDSNLAVGDKIILTGTIGDHGLAVLSAQQGLKFGSEIRSDVKPLNRMIQRLLRQSRRSYRHERSNPRRLS